MSAKLPVPKPRSGSQGREQKEAASLAAQQHQALIVKFDHAVIFGPRAGLSRLLRLQRALSFDLFVDEDTQAAILRDPSSALDAPSV